MVRKILVLGSGIVGEATGAVMAEHGLDVTFADVNSGVIGRLREKGHRAFLTEELTGPEADLYLISVPTYPIDLCQDEANATVLAQSMTPQEWCKVGIDFTKNAARTIGKWLSRRDGYRVVVLRSAVLPGTTEETIIPILEAQSGKKAGEDFGVCINPEYLRENSSLTDTAKPWVIVIGGLDKRSGDAVQEVYQWVACPVYRISIKEAEMQKFVHNLFNAAKISFFNEMRLISRHIGVDFENIVPIVIKSAEGIWNPAYGTRNMGPFGGKCLPKDTFAFIEWAKQSGFEARMVEAAVEVNKIIERQLQPLPG